MEQLAAVLHDTELCLEERSRLVQDLELAISEKASALETLKKRSIQRLRRSQKLNRFEALFFKNYYRRCLVIAEKMAKATQRGIRIVIVP